MSEEYKISCKMIYELECKMESVLHYKLKEHDKSALLSKRLKLAKGSKKSTGSWYWMQNREIDRWGLPLTSVRPILNYEGLYIGKIKIHDILCTTLMKFKENDKFFEVEIFDEFECLDEELWLVINKSSFLN